MDLPRIEKHSIEVILLNQHKMGDKYKSASILRFFVKRREKM